MATSPKTPIVQSESFVSQTAAVAAEPGSIAIQNIANALNAVDDQGVATALGSGGGGGTVTAVSGTAPISVATGTTTPVVSIVAATTSVPGSMSAADKTKLDALPGTWVTVSVPSDTNDVVLSSALNGDTDGGYEIDVVLAATSDTSTQYSLNIGVDGGAASATGCTSCTNFGNGSITASQAQTRLDILTASSVATSQQPAFKASLQGARTGLLRTWLAFGQRLTAGGTTNVAFFETMGNYQATGNITTLTLHASTANGFKAGSIVRYRKVNA